MIRWCTTARSSTVWTIEAQWPHFSQLTLASHASPRHQVLILLCFLVGQFQVTVIPFVNLIVLSLDTILIMFFVMCQVTTPPAESALECPVPCQRLEELRGHMEVHHKVRQRRSPLDISPRTTRDSKPNPHQPVRKRRTNQLHYHYHNPQTFLKLISINLHWVLFPCWFFSFSWNLYLSYSDMQGQIMK